MPTVEVRFAALPAHVRTARLIAVAVARRARIAEELLDELRLAVGEACSRAVALHQRHAIDAPVTMRLSDEADRLVVEVLDTGPVDELAGDGFDPIAAVDAAMSSFAADLGVPDIPGQRSGRDPLPPGFGLAVISGLVDSVEIEPGDPTGTRVAMSWPLAPAGRRAVEPAATGLAEPGSANGRTPE